MAVAVVRGGLTDFARHFQRALSDIEATFDGDDVHKHNLYLDTLNNNPEEVAKHLERLS